MRRSLALLFPVSALLAGGCVPRVDVTEAANVLLETDRAWAKVADSSSNPDSIVAYWTADARVIAPGQPVLAGRDALRAMVAASLAVPGFHITWTPEAAVVSPEGELGYTYGTNRLSAPDSTGRLTTTAGRYVTVWRKEPDGKWRCSIDIFNVGPLTR
jgi:ketosteroid isomerase-like protein